MKLARPHQHLTTTDLVTISILSALGGVLSTYVGYLANLVNDFVGTPFGAGQFLAGLHVFWLLLARCVTGKTGSGTLAGALKGMVEMLSGSIHGALVVLVSTVEGMIVDAAMVKSRPESSVQILLAGGLATASNVFVFQALFLSGVPFLLVSVIAAMAFASGVIFGGYFCHHVLVSLSSSGLLKAVPRPSGAHRWRMRLGYVLMAVFVGGALWFFACAYRWEKTSSFEVEGLVERPFNYRESDFHEDLVTVQAELKGSYIHLEPRNYTGVPLSAILRRAAPKASASRVRLVASDGYSVVLDLHQVMENPEIIVVRAGNGSSLVADDLDGSQWIQGIVRVEVR